MKPSDAPRRELLRAHACISSIQEAKSFDDFYENWVDFLHRIERVWFKCQAHFGKSPKWNGWRGKYETRRNDDPLLRYLRHARGAEEHTIAPLAMNAAVKLMPLDPDKQMPNFSFGSDEGGNLQIKSDGPFSMIWSGGGAQLIDVRNRGVTYTVPASHLSQKVNPSDLHQIMQLAVSFYGGLLDEAEKAFHK